MDIGVKIKEIVSIYQHFTEKDTTIEKQKSVHVMCVHVFKCNVKKVTVIISFNFSFAFKFLSVQFIIIFKNVL